VLRLRGGVASPAVELWRLGEGPRVVLRGEGSAAMAAAVVRAWGEGLGAMAGDEIYPGGWREARGVRGARRTGRRRPEAAAG